MRDFFLIAIGFLLGIVASIGVIVFVKHMEGYIP